MSANAAERFDVVIVGGGPAGMSAALVLGRCRRRVLLCDVGRPRNYAARGVHNFLTRDGITPGELRGLGRAELLRCGVEIREMLVTGVAREPCDVSWPATRIESPIAEVAGHPFEVTLDNGQAVRTRKLVLATGVCDVLPPIPDVEELYGRGVYHCPYCDGWEVREKPLVAYGRGRRGAGLGLALRTWSDDVTVCSDGTRIPRAVRTQLEANGIAWRTERIARLEACDGRLAGVIFEKGARLACSALFFNTTQVQRSSLPQRIGCGFMPGGGVRIDRRGRTGIPGLFLAGDASREVQFVITAASDGAKAGVAINRELQDEERGALRPEAAAGTPE